MQTIHVTDYMIERHKELIPVYKKLGKTEYVVKETQRLESLLAMRKNSQLQIQFEQ